VERAKREREERQRRVEKNYKEKQQIEQAKLQQFREHHEKVREFQMRQETASPASFRNPNIVVNEKQQAGQTKVLQQLRERHEKTREFEEVTSPASFSTPSTFVKKQIDLIGKPLILDSFMNSPEEYAMTPEKVPAPSTKDNYNVDNLSSGDETDDDEKPKKTVPTWARQPAILASTIALHKKLTDGQIERYFGKMKEPDYVTIFKREPNKDRGRNPSAEWNSPLSDPTPGKGRYAMHLTPRK